MAVVGTQAWNPIVHGGGSGRVIASWVKPPLWSLCDMLGVDRVDNTTSESSSCNKRNGNCVTYFDGTETPPPSASADYDVALLFVQTSSSEGIDRTNLTFGAEQENMLVNGVM